MHRPVCNGPSSGESPNDEGTYLRDSLVIPVDVDDPQAMVDSGHSDQEVGDRGAVPHAVVMGQVLLQAKGPVEKVRRRGDDPEVLVQVRLEIVVVTGRASRVQLLE